jgi:hypothetical protein
MEINNHPSPQQPPIHIHNESKPSGYIVLTIVVLSLLFYWEMSSTNDKVASLQAAVGTNAQSRIDRLEAISTFLYSNSTVVHGDLTRAGSRFSQDETVLGVLYTNAVQQQVALSNILAAIQSAAVQQKAAEPQGGAGRSR